MALESAWRSSGMVRHGRRSRSGCPWMTRPKQALSLRKARLAGLASVGNITAFSCTVASTIGGASSDRLSAPMRPVVHRAGELHQGMSGINDLVESRAAQIPLTLSHRSFSRIACPPPTSSGQGSHGSRLEKIRCAEFAMKTARPTTKSGKLEVARSRKKPCGSRGSKFFTAGQTKGVGEKPRIRTVVETPCRR